jgi:hypothetical protein
LSFKASARASAAARGFPWRTSCPIIGRRRELREGLPCLVEEPKALRQSSLGLGKDASSKNDPSDLEATVLGDRGLERPIVERLRFLVAGVTTKIGSFIDGVIESAAGVGVFLRRAFTRDDEEGDDRQHNPGFQDLVLRRSI